MAISVQTKTAPALSLTHRASFKFWLAYFFLTIGIFGIFVGYGMIVPLALLGRRWPLFQTLSDRIMLYGIRVLFFCQPWFVAHLDSSQIQGGQAKGARKVLFVSNHRSHLDVFLFLTVIPGVRILAKKALFSVPFLAPYMRFTRQIPVEQGRIDLFLEAMERVRERIELGENVLVFPELTRCPAGYQGTQNFSLAPFKVAKDIGALVIPVVVQETDTVWPKGRLGLSFRRPVRLKILEPLNPDNYETSESLKTAAQERINSQLL
jgi:1-acyl-sn-glycerol-3-phosphate acyltransferase